MEVSYQIFFSSTFKTVYCYLISHMFMFFYPTQVNKTLMTSSCLISIPTHNALHSSCGPAGSGAQQLGPSWEWATSISVILHLDFLFSQYDNNCLLGTQHYEA